MASSFADVFGPEADGSGNTLWSLSKRTNKQGRWGKRDIFLSFQSEEAAEHAAQERRQLELELTDCRLPTGTCYRTQYT